MIDFEQQARERQRQMLEEQARPLRERLKNEAKEEDFREYLEGRETRI